MSQLLSRIAKAIQKRVNGKFSLFKSQPVTATVKNTPKHENNVATESFDEFLAGIRDAEHGLTENVKRLKNIDLSELLEEKKDLSVDEMTVIAKLSFEGLANTPRDPGKAVELWKIASERGDRAKQRVIQITVPLIT